MITTTKRRLKLKRIVMVVLSGICFIWNLKRLIGAFFLLLPWTRVQSQLNQGIGWNCRCFAHVFIFVCYAFIWRLVSDHAIFWQRLEMAEGIPCHIETALSLRHGKALRLEYLSRHVHRRLAYASKTTIVTPLRAGLIRSLGVWSESRHWSLLHLLLHHRACALSQVIRTTHSWIRIVILLHRWHLELAEVQRWAFVS